MTGGGSGIDAPTPLRLGRNGTLVAVGELMLICSSIN